MHRRVFLALILVCLAGGVPGRAAVLPSRVQWREGLDPRVRAALEDFRKRVPGQLKAHKVPGAAFALVDDQGMLWAEGFGLTDHRGGTPVNPDTLFLLGGMSRLVSATAVMVAAQEGLVDLDAPIARYLPDFKFNSRYEEAPQTRITLRHLLSHTSGLPVEATVGNYFEPSPLASFEAHARSLEGCWLVHPVGQAFLCSNAGADLAAYVVQVAARRPFEQYLSERVLAPLGMVRSTADRAVVLQATNRAVGHMMGIARMPVVFPLLGSAGIYSSAADLGRFVQMQICGGAPGGRRFLDARWVEALQTPAGIVESSPPCYYGLGVFVDKRAPERTEPILWQDGWGLGFSSFMHWYPEYRIGAVALSNRLPNPGLNDLALALTDRLIREGLAGERRAGFRGATNRCVGAWWGWPGHQPTPWRAEWRQRAGTYPLTFNAYELDWWAKLMVLVKGRDEYTPRIALREKDGHLCLTESKFFDTVGVGRHVDQPLQEYRPGLFFTASGIALDFTGDTPAWRNYRLKKR